jgi:hypothetical protein
MTATWSGDPMARRRVRTTAMSDERGVRHPAGTTTMTTTMTTMSDGPTRRRPDGSPTTRPHAVWSDSPRSSAAVARV